jgi:hypothetical protein
MTSQCPECGAASTPYDNCTDRFHRFLALEMTDPEFGTVHHLTVLAYMLQHPSQLSLQGWQEMRRLLTEFLDTAITPENMRTLIRKDFRIQKRTWSLSKGPKLQIPKGFSWKRTILSVDETTGERYRGDIEEWARQVSLDAAALWQGVKSGGGHPS